MGQDSNLLDVKAFRDSTANWSEPKKRSLQAGPEADRALQSVLQLSGPLQLLTEEKILRKELDLQVNHILTVRAEAHSGAGLSLRAGATSEPPAALCPAVNTMCLSLNVVDICLVFLYEAVLRGST